MESRYSLKELLRILLEEKAERNALAEEGHLSPEDFLEIAGEGGLSRAAPGVLEHLALCPWCLEKWRLLQGFEEEFFTEKAEEAGRGSAIFQEYVYLEAASTREAGTGILCQTTDRRVRLSLYPGDERNPEKVYVALSVEDQDLRRRLEDRPLTLSFYDKARRKILEVKGFLRGGKFAKILDLKEDFKHRMRDVASIGIEAHEG